MNFQLARVQVFFFLCVILNGRKQGDWTSAEGLFDGLILDFFRSVCSVWGLAM